MSSEFSDPLNLLLNPMDSSMEDSGSDNSSPQDWSQLSTLWDGTDPNQAMKYDIMDFNDLGSLPLDMEFDPTMGLDANALHYDALKYTGYSYDPAPVFHNMPTDLLPPQFPFSFQSAMESASSFSSGASSSGSSTKERRLSVTSTSSSSGASLSPVADDHSPPSPPSENSFSPQPTTPKFEVKKQEAASPISFDPAVELAERVRQTAGVMLAVPMSAQLHALSQALDLQQANAQNKMPISRLPRNSASPKSPQSSSSSAASTPPPATPPMSSALPSGLTIDTKPIISASGSCSTLPTPTTAVMPGTSGRPKTSHTTIERRYRTNLNARIQSLRMAVPALRVLEDRDGGNGKKIKKNLKDGVYLKGAGIGIDGENGTVDVIDERGFVDGVKVARKCSKANVLGKAVEYIRVLKKREIRLKAEHAGLKTLMCGLVGGPALVKEWEQRWRERFGGEEKDEVEGEEAEDFDSDDEDGEDGDEEVGKKRKRAKTSALPFKKAADKKATPTPAPSSVANVITQLGGTAPGATVAPEKRKRGRPRKIPVPPTPVATLAPHGSQQQQHDQIMLAPHVEQQQQHQPQQYLLAVFALFSFFNSPLTSSYGFSSSPSPHTGVLLNPPLALAPEIISQFMPPAPVESAHAFLGVGWRECAQSFQLLVSVLVLGSFVCSWMGVSISLRKKGPSLKRGADGRVDWTAVCHESVLDRKSLPLLSSVRMYASLLSAKTPSIPQLASLALAMSRGKGGLLGGLARAKARSLWATAKSQVEMAAIIPGRRPVKLAEKLVLENWSLDEAVKELEAAKEVSGIPMEVLGALLVRQRVKRHLGTLFVNAVGGCVEEKVVEMEMRKTIEAARELGGDAEDLGRTFERVWKSSVLDGEILGEEDEEMKALLTGLVLYKKLFTGPTAVCVTSALLSPPPSPTPSRSSKGGNVLLDLRKALGSRVFEDGEDGEMEVARDRVVDLIVDMERRGRSASPP